MPISYRAAQNLIKRNDEPGLRLALDQSLDPNLANENGWTLLMLAAVEGSPTLVQLLLERGADKDAKNRKGESARSIATQKGHTEVVELLRG